MQTLFALVGPTAVGKTDTYFRLVADGFPFEAVSADSRQVYKGMDIGTGKDLPQNQPAPVWLIDQVDPNQPFSSAQFYTAAQATIANIFTRHMNPLIVGGTGRYLQDLLIPPATLTIPPNPELRSQLNTFSTPQLQQLLQKLQPNRFNQMNHSDQSNPRRLIRAIEVAQSPVTQVNTLKYSCHILGLIAPLQLIKQRIEARVKMRVNQGMVQEVQGLLTTYPDFATFQSYDTPGYQEITAYLNHQLSLDQAIDLWTQREIKYAKRQLTWFKHQTQALWFDIDHPYWYADVVNQLKRWGLCQK